MRAYVVKTPGNVEFSEVSRPSPGPYEALVQMELCVICNSTDNMIVKGSFPYPIEYPCVLGHESVGTVVEVGKYVTSFKAGDRVTRAGYRPDPDTSGVHSAWGGFADYGIAEDVAAKKKAGVYHGYENQSPQLIPSDISSRDASLFICLGELSSFTQQMGDLQGKHVVVLGTGIAGLAITYFSKLWGAAAVVTIGRRDSRLELARKLGADRTLNIASDFFDQEDLFGTADVLVEATGNRMAFENTFAYLKENGNIAIYGLAEESYHFPLSKGPKSFEVNQYAPNESGTMAMIGQMAREGKLPVDLLISHEWKFDDLDSAFEQVRKGEVVKGIVWIR
jgi:2-desacetyl-2-hydroxyethyl bacteriochlorophyllide A dehydrogenase